eukprot:TRINITY_DN7556_c0_g1_i7.p1 TRINITY_DN7556_c0_g1~~TRINITY_DN7556_c0_g1_i7.p1  ORF type:complete len:345 (+),score=99.95 TRINITY_DN7556_c0_g1_i7:105-1139(+)
MEMIRDQSESKRPQDTPFKQQRLKAWQPILTPRWVIGSFVVLTIIFIPIGVVVLSASRSVVEVSKRYDNDPSCSIGNRCSVYLDIPSDMQAPVFFYYQLSNFYQNHRRYVKSRSDTQLRGDAIESASDDRLSSCDPLISSQNKPIYPCGLIANSFFNDRFNACVIATGVRTDDCNSLNGTNWQQKGIAWDSDLDKKFKTPATLDRSKLYTKNTRGFDMPDVTDEDFVVWMRTAGLPTFKKLHRKVLDRSFKKGETVRIDIQNNFPVRDFDGEKAVVLSTVSWVGGKNDFLGWAYIVVGIVCFVLGLAFLVKECVSPRPLGDLNYFNWNAGAGKDSSKSNGRLFK